MVRQDLPVVKPRWLSEITSCSPSALAQILGGSVLWSPRRRVVLEWSKSTLRTRFKFNYSQSSGEGRNKSKKLSNKFHQIKASRGLIPTCGEKFDVDVAKEEYIFHPSALIYPKYLFKMLILISAISYEEYSLDTVNAHLFFKLFKCYFIKNYISCYFSNQL